MESEALFIKRGHIFVILFKEGNLNDKEFTYWSELYT